MGAGPERPLCLLERIALSISVPVIYHGLRLAVRLPDRVLEYIFRSYKAVAYPFVDDPQVLYQCDEMIEVFRNFPEYARAIRRLVLEARPEQMRSALRGMVLHHVLGA